MPCIFLPACRSSDRHKWTDAILRKGNLAWYEIVLLQGPREDSGFLSAVNPGVRMAERIYNFCKKFHPKTNVMVSGVRKPAGSAAFFEKLPVIRTSKSGNFEGKICHVVMLYHGIDTSLRSPRP